MQGSGHDPRTCCGQRQFVVPIAWLSQFCSSLFPPRIPYQGGKMQRVVRSTLVGVLTLAGLTACGDKVPLPPPVTTTTVPSNVVRSVTVTPASANLNVGDKVSLTASVNADAGVTDRTVTWSSGD